ncbi:MULTISPECIES: hypothetical protein [unclassified Sphingobium]|uniref:hypothetical protein n=1 Tax=unclassified Sphingobium TaxID=2611147 RepID=UPI0035A5AA29
MLRRAIEKKILVLAVALSFLSTGMCFAILGDFSAWGELIMAPLGFLLLTPFLGAAQLALAGCIYLARHIVVKTVLLSASVVMLAILCRFLMTGDFTSRSTAPLAAPFFGLYLGFLAALGGGTLVGLEHFVRWLRERRSP